MPVTLPPPPQSGTVLDRWLNLLWRKFSATGEFDHNSGGSLQGGTAGQYYHLTSTEYTGSGTGVFARVTGAEINPTSIGATTAGSGAFTTLSASGAITAAGGQISFPATQSASADANTLDDYEEKASVTLTIKRETSDPTYSANADYSPFAVATKIGNTVFVSAKIPILTVVTGQGTGTYWMLRLTGLPATQESWSVNTVIAGRVPVYISGTTVYGDVVGLSTTSVEVQISTTDLATLTASPVSFSFCYTDVGQVYTGGA